MSKFKQRLFDALNQTDKVLPQYFLKRGQVKRAAMKFKAVTDKIADKTIFSIVNNKSSNHSIISEERRIPSTFKEYVCRYDSIEGITNFNRGFPLWGILITFLYKGQPILTGARIPQIQKY